MVYKKFIEKNGKIYGPYIYHSERVNGKVVSKYLGNGQENKSYKDFIWIFILLFSILFLTYFIYIFNNQSMQGKVILDLETSYQENQSLQGVLSLSLKKGELLPASSKIVVEDSLGNKNEYAISGLVSADTTEGNFYIEGASLTGEGAGYGSIGNRVVYPIIYFILDINKESGRRGGETPTEEGITEQTPTEETPTETQEETPAEEQTTTEDKTKEKETKNNKKKSKTNEITGRATEEIAGEITKETTNETSTGNFIFNFFAGILNAFRGTGQASLDVKTEVNGQVSGDSPYTYILADGQIARLRPGSVRTDYETLSSSDVNLITEGDQLTVTTDYFETEDGFGADYLGDVDETLNINLSSLNLLVNSGNLKVSVVSGSDIIISTSVNLVSGETSTTTNQTILNKTLNMTKTPEIRLVFLTEVEKQALLDKFGNNSVKTNTAKVFKDRLIVRNEIGDYWIEYSYKYNGEVTDSLKKEIEKDILRWLKDISKKLIIEKAKAGLNESAGNVEGIIGNYSIDSITPGGLITAENITASNETQEINETTTEPNPEILIEEENATIEEKDKEKNKTKE
ncbi:MAG: hypothetical protein AABX30_00020 [Nanoarchaeota archaeon]